jgi:hypothetical protein
MAAAAFVVVDSAPAAARGCGGYVNQLVWGCAYWDNNQKCPYHPDCRKAAPQARPAPVYNPAVQPGYNSGNGLVAQGGGNRPGSGIVSTGGGNRPSGYR